MVSYFEWLQNRSNDYWSLEKVEAKLEEIMGKTFWDFMKIKEGSKEPISNRSAVYKLGLDNLWNAYAVKRD
jgi:glutamate dehydrogenase (NADP+)